MKRFVAGLALVLATSGAWALPTVDEVEAQVRQGNYTQAETMMSEVVAAKPGSARAHYFYAELLAHNGSFARASQEAAKAREIDPKISFTEPEKFRSFEQTLQREQSAPRTSSSSSTSSTRSGSSMVPAAAATGALGSGGIPGWVWLVGLAILAFVLWKAFTRSRATPAGNLATAGGPQGASPFGNNSVSQGAAFGPGATSYGPAAGMQGGPMQQGARPGGGLLGTGLAVAGGVAGGMLIDQMLHRGGDGGGAGSGIGNLGGVEPGGNSGNGVFGGDGAAQELENRPIDFGNGGNDWDSGGGSGDSGGGDSGGGGWD